MIRYRAAWRIRRAAAAAVLATLVLAATAVGTAQGSNAAQATKPTVARQATRPTVVLVHGAWANSSSWDGVVRRLHRDGFTVDVFPTPLRSLSGDAAYLQQYLGAISGPIVLVGHSYGGAVISDAATGNAQVRALVFIDAFVPEQGEAVATLAGSQSVLANPDPTQVFDFVPATLPPTASTDLYVKRTVFPGAFANDLPLSKGAVLAATQRPITLGALNEPSSLPAWKTIPSWYEVGTIDKVIPPDRQLAMAERADAHIVKARTSHLPMVSKPGAVTETIEMAARH
jgi:pimeloyl-ACP methyl ester carboxylesterase